MYTFNRFIALLVLMVLFGSNILIAADKTLSVSSPDNNIQVNIGIGKKLTYALSFKKEPIITASPISLTLQDGTVLGANPKLKSQIRNAVNTTINATIYKKNIIQNHYNELVLNFKNDFGIIVRAYNDGAAYRFFTKKNGEIIIQNEEASFNFGKNYKTIIPYTNVKEKADPYYNSFENMYTTSTLSEVDSIKLAFLPLLVDGEKAFKLAITESDLEEYPGMFVKTAKAGGQALKGVFAPYPKTLLPKGDYAVLVTERYPYIAKVQGTRNYPWRVMVITDKDADLLNNDMVYKLARPNVIGDVSWVKPGKVMWDWWHDWNLAEVDFKAGPNTATYKHYIDFCSAYNIEYLNLDDGWSKRKDMLEIMPDVDLPEVLRYAKEKNVNILLWCTWHALNKDMPGIMKKYADMGVKGFKMDFMDRDDQEMVRFYEQTLKEAAKHKLVIDFHGAFKPTGLNRTYPNELNREGVFGAENYKGGPKNNTENETTIPFIRMLAGHLDYTPGGMRNTTEKMFRPVGSMPMVKGTRVHQLAMYVIYESPLQMVSDLPHVYRREKDAMDFLSKVPTVWDETVVPAAELANYAVIARRKGKEWYVGALNDETERDTKIKLDFLPTGEFTMDIHEDGPNANKNAVDYKRRQIKVNKHTEMTLKLARGGGFAARIY